MYRLTYLHEQDLWWYRGMNQLLDLLIEQGHHLGRLEILDAGCGTGGTMARLAARGRVTGFDVSETALGYSRARGLRRLAQASITALPFRAGAFDLVVSLDVVHSLPRERHVPILREFARVLRPGGHALVRMGAYDFLRGAHDRASHVRFRYTAGGLARALRQAGFRVERVTYANATLLPVVVAKRMLERLREPDRELKTDFWRPPEALNRALASVLYLENALVRRGVSLPFGVSVVGLARLGAGD
jgi:SAM-dependent methyltransferase